MRRVSDENTKLKLDYDISECLSTKLNKENAEMRIEVEKLRHRIIKLRKKKHTGVYANS